MADILNFSALTEDRAEKDYFAAARRLDKCDYLSDAEKYAILNHYYWRWVGFQGMTAENMRVVGW